MNKNRRADVVVIGGGLAGMTAALRLAKSGKDVVVIDDSLPDAEGRIGGFARFSGAKFSLPPAGMGLLPVAGSEERFASTIDSVLGLLGLDGTAAQASLDTPAGAGVSLRLYRSILLTPTEMDTLLDDLSRRVKASTQLIFGKATRLERIENGWTVDVAAGHESLKLTSSAIFYAAGRLSDGILLNAGAEPTEGKGVDVGVRLEFEDKSALSALRNFGPDAKVIDGDCRTFCLNSPGTIYRYHSNGFYIPGGVVAEPEVLTGNVGVLLRLAHKRLVLEKVARCAVEKEEAVYAESNQWRNGAMSPTPILIELFGQEPCERLCAFVNSLGRTGLADLAKPYRQHLPLVDWHWNTFALVGSHRTSLPEVYAIGDSSGHARGLLQACMSGWLAAEEYLC